MMRFFLCILLAAGVSGIAERERSTVEQQASQLALDRSWTRILDRQDAANPLAPVVTLLNEITVKCKSDLKTMSDSHDKSACSCKDDATKLRKGIKDNVEKLSQVELTIKTSAAETASFYQDFMSASSQYADNKQSLDETSAMRKKDSESFIKSEKDSTVNIANLGSAIKALAAHADAALPQLYALSFLQSPWGLESQPERDMDKILGGDELGKDASSDDGFLHATAPALAKARDKASEGWSMLDLSTIQSAMHTAKSFMQQSGQDSSNLDSAHSGEILGILKNMQENMQRDLKQAQADETKAATDYLTIKDTKENLIALSKAEMLAKETGRAEADSLNAAMQKKKASTKALLKQDQAALSKLDAKCDKQDKSFNEQRKTRFEEMKAVGDAVEMLTAEGVQARATKSLSRSGAPAPAPALLQLSTKNHADLRHKAMKLLRRAAAHSHSATLGLLAFEVAGLDDMKKVMKAIEKLSAQLETDQADEVKEFASCTDRKNSNDGAVTAALSEQDIIASKLLSLKSKLGTAKSQIAGNVNTTDAKNKNLADKLIVRNKENADFKQSQLDQGATIDVLKKAVNRLAVFYSDKASLAQMPAGHHVDTVKSTGEVGVIVVIEHLIQKAMLVTKESKNAEAFAQKAYEDLLASTELEQRTLAGEKLEFIKTKVKSDVHLRHRKLDKTANDNKVIAMKKTQADLVKECGFLLTNFDARQKARMAEMQSLRQVSDTLTLTA